MDETPIIRWENGQGVIAEVSSHKTMNHDSHGVQQLKQAGLALRDRQKRLPTLIVAVLPEAGADIYAAIKQ